eukprot:TRINITY_DN73239_c0_g1_i1.p1 TRINITY_DN73239_c0_g1~~TRINITY_DN73239_c0_g1_i1.p1  ORF type:complete len:826 (+),score=170.90 TRINITY_DN73239_c0_g1_i1:130-2607(+)
MQSFGVARAEAMVKPALERMAAFQQTLQGLDVRAWDQPGPAGLAALCEELDLCTPCGDDFEQACIELAGEDSKGIAVCDFLAFVCGAQPSDQDFSRLTAIHDQSESAIPNPVEAVEERGMILDQFEALLHFMKVLCGAGDVITGWFDSRQQLSSLPLREASIKQLRHWIIEPLTAELGLSYVEVIGVADGTMQKTFFISHYWGGAMRDFVKCVSRHIQIRGLPPRETNYWDCAFALSKQELGTGPLQGPCVRAMATASGVLFIVDPAVMVFRRSWCLFEAALPGLASRGHFSQVDHMTGVNGPGKLPGADLPGMDLPGMDLPGMDLPGIIEEAGADRRSDLQRLRDRGQVGQPPSLLLDLATVIKGRRGDTAELLVDGLTETEQEWEEHHPGMGQVSKTDREQHFPLEVIRAGMEVDITTSEASQPQDRVRILNALAGKSGKELDEPTPFFSTEVSDDASARSSWHEALNLYLRGTFARSGIAQALQARFDTSSFLAALSADTEQTQLELPCLSYVLSEPNRFVADLGSAIACLRNLRQLRLNFGWQSTYAEGTIGSLTDVAQLGNGLGHLVNLEVFVLKLSGCRNLRNTEELAQGLGQLSKLRELKLCFNGCEGLTDVSTLGQNMGKLQSLTDLDLNLSGCRFLEDIVELGSNVRYLTQMRRLKLAMSGCMNIFYVKEFGKSLKQLPRLMHLEVDLSWCTSLDDISDLGKGIRYLMSLSPFGHPKPKPKDADPDAPAPPVDWYFHLSLEKSGMRLNREECTYFDDPKKFITALGSKADRWNEDEESEDLQPPPAPKVKKQPYTHAGEEAERQKGRVLIGFQGSR